MKKQTMRMSKVIAVVGKKGSGKSMKTIQDILEVIKKAPKERQPVKCIIMDTNDEYSYFMYPFALKSPSMSFDSITVDGVEKFMKSKRSGIRIIRPFDIEGNRLSYMEWANAVQQVGDTFKDGILFVEDCTKFMPMHTIKYLTAANRIRKLDIILTFQSVETFMLSNIIGNTDYVRLHRTNDPVKRSEKKLGLQYEMLSIAERFVRGVREEYADENIAPDPYVCLYLDIDNLKIRRTGFGQYPWLALAIHQYWFDEGETLMASIRASKPKLKAIKMELGLHKRVDKKAMSRHLLSKLLAQYLSQ